jgi:hypothetical protein
MKNKQINKRLLIVVILIAAFILIDRSLDKFCPVRLGEFDIDPTIHILNLYPWPGAKIPFACHIRDFVRSPFAPKTVYRDSFTYKEDGFAILEGWQRKGVITADILATNKFRPAFENPVAGKMPLLANSISFYVDDKKLNMGHVSLDLLTDKFLFATILNPFLLPGKHTGKIVLLLPSGEANEYEWQFEITWW